MAGLVGHVHLDVLADYDVKRRVVEGQVGDVTLTDGDPAIQPDELIEPTSSCAVLIGEVDGGDSAAVLVGEERAVPPIPVLASSTVSSLMIPARSASWLVANRPIVRKSSSGPRSAG
jgi:hypothetical protein